MTNQTINFASWGRVSTEDRQDPESSRGWQHARGKALIEPHGGRIVTEFFDIDKSRSIPPQRRPEASRLLDALADPNRGFEAVVVGEPQRAFYGNQFGNTFPLFAHYGVPLWVPEVGGPIDPDNEAHDLIMSVFGGVSKGERNRIRIRVRTAMATQAQIEGRYLGGRPPYGYLLIDVGPHPNPAKAADGKKLHALAVDDPAAAVVRRIFAEFLAGHGIYAIAEHLTRDGIACPSAHDPARNSHRCGVAWSKSAIRAILANPRYTGRQVWNKQRKDEVLIDVHDVALGHTTKQRWNDQDRWIFSDNLVHPPIIDADTFTQAQQVLACRAQVSGPRERFRRRHDYVLGGRLICGLCDRKMQAHWSNEMAYYRCRFPAEYAVANMITHPRNVFVRERDLVPELDAWLAREFEPHRLAETIDDLAAASADLTGHQQAIAEAQATIKECDAKMTRYQAAIDAGADITEVTKWINATKTDRLTAEAILRGTSAPTRMTRTEVAGVIERFTSLVAVIRDADPADKAEIYNGLNLALTYHPENRTVNAEVAIREDHHGVMVGVRGGTCQLRTWPCGHFDRLYPAARQAKTCLLSAASCLSGAWRDWPGGSVYPADDDWVRGPAGGDRGYGVVPSYACTRRTARPAGVGGGADALVSRRHDRRRVDFSACRFTGWKAGRSVAVGASGDRKRGESGRECRGGRANSDG
jgi:site-specific DNA recombinase